MPHDLTHMSNELSMKLVDSDRDDRGHIMGRTFHPIFKALRLGWGRIKHFKYMSLELKASTHLLVDQQHTLTVVQLTSRTTPLSTNVYLYKETSIDFASSEEHSMLARVNLGIHPGYLPFQIKAKLTGMPKRGKAIINVKHSAIACLPIGTL